MTRFFSCRETTPIVMTLTLFLALPGLLGAWYHNTHGNIFISDRYLGAYASLKVNGTSVSKTPGHF